MGNSLSSHIDNQVQSFTNVLDTVDHNIQGVVDSITSDIPSKSDEKRETRLRQIHCSNIDAGLTNAVAAHLDELIQDISPSTSFCGNLWPNWVFLRQRMLAFLGQCFQMNYITVFLYKDTNLASWMRLHASAIRCSMEQCPLGFVFLDWENIEGREGSWGHATAVYLDVPAKRQVFLDPSSALKYTVIGNVLDYFREHHI